MSKSKAARKQEGKSDLSLKRSKNKSLLTKEAVAGIESEPGWKSVLVLQQYRQDQRADGEAVKGSEMMYGKEAIMNAVDFERGGSLPAWNNAKEPTRSQTRNKFETLVPHENFLRQNVRGTSGNEQLEIRELEAVEDWKVTEKNAFPDDHIAPSLSRKFDEGERSAAAERTAAERNGVLVGATGDEGVGFVENSMQNAATFPIPQMIPRTVAIGYVTAGYLGVGESVSLSQANGLPDIECVAKGDSLAKSSADKSDKTTSLMRVEVRSKDECPDEGASVPPPEKCTAEGMSDDAKDPGEAVERKDVPGCWADSSAYFCSCSDTCPAKADCGGDFVVGFSHEFGRQELASTAARKPDYVRGYPDEENADFIKKSLEEIGLIPLRSTGPAPDLNAIGRLTELVRRQMGRDAFLPPLVESRPEPQCIQQLQEEETASPFDCPGQGNQEGMDAGQASDGAGHEMAFVDVEAEEDTIDQEDDLSTIEDICDSSLTDRVYLQHQSGINALATGIAATGAGHVTVAKNANLDIGSRDIAGDSDSERTAGVTGGEEKPRSDRTPYEAMTVNQPNGRWNEVCDLESCPKWSDMDEKWNDPEAIGGAQAMRDESMCAPEEPTFRSLNNFQQDM